MPSKQDLQKSCQDTNMVKKKKCELCLSKSATSYCESDDASLCWECDAGVHRANFLVAKHSRVVLCRVCQNPTRWVGSGVQLDPVARACSDCTNGAATEVDEDDDVTSDDSCTDEEEESDDDQVVPTPILQPTKI